MAFTCGFYNSVNHDRKYDAVQHGMIFDGIITDGIYATYLKAMVVKASSNPSEVIVQPGRAWFNHTWSYNDADYPVAAPDPEVVLDRIDTLVLDINSEDAVRDNQFLWVQGTPTSQVPEPPELIHTATHNQYPLCDVYRQAGTTQIYAADITNRVGTSDCPFVTGVLEGINIDDLLAQWDDEFHTWENATKASFEGWMLNQQAVYSAWWDSLKTQMAGDVADVEEWVQTIKDIIDEETATHLQLEIDEINSMLPSGSHITVTTADTELYSRPVTITDEDDNTVTSQFDATGVAVFKSVPYVGNLTIEATDGIRTATAVVNTPYFARYEFPLAFWSATVNITGDTELGGETVTITDSSQILVGTVVLNASGTGVFNATYPDTYKFSVTHGGQTMEVSLAVTQETTYNVTIHAGFNWRDWVDTAKFLDSSDYNSLDEVLADELAVRELCLEHACVDYLAAVPSVNADIETIINNDLFAKWANNSDYSLNTLEANAAIKALMDTADKYGYGEWALVGQVPKMTSNTTPYGEVGASRYDSTNGPAYYAFNETIALENGWQTPQNVTTDVRIWYHFPSSVSIKRIMYVFPNSAVSPKDCEWQYSQDGETWVTAKSVTYSQPSALSSQYEDLDTNVSAPYWGLHVRNNQGSTNYIRVVELQFYAWQPKGNVPKMTSSTAPYGTVTASSYATNYDAYTAFTNETVGYGWLPNADATNNHIGYTFTNPVKAEKVKLVFVCAGTRTTARNCKIQGYTGSAWADLAEVTIPAGVNGERKEIYVEIENPKYYMQYRLFCATALHVSGDYILLKQLQFYGRELSVSVPTMATNTTPYGEASGDGETVSEQAAYRAFSQVSGDFWMSVSNQDYNRYLEYAFVSPTVIKHISLTIGTRTSATILTPLKFHFEAYDGSEWVSITEVTTHNTNNDTTYDFDVEQSVNAQKIRYVVDQNLVNNNTRSNHMSCAVYSNTQFYGLDYSEKEFEEGTTKKWLYDHGVELETITPIYPTNAKKTIEGLDFNIVSNPGANVCSGFVTDSFDLTNYTVARAKLGNKMIFDTGGGRCGQIMVATNLSEATKAWGNYTLLGNFNMTPSYVPYNSGFDISSINQSAQLFIGDQNGQGGPMRFIATELWLE